MVKDIITERETRIGVIQYHQHCDILCKNISKLLTFTQPLDVLDDVLGIE